MLLVAVFAAGCAAPQFKSAELGVPAGDRGYLAVPPEHFSVDGTVASEDDEAPQPNPRALPMFLGESGKLVSWDDLLRAAAWADVIFVGEEHDDAVGHAVQRAIMEDIASRYPHAALSMEMLERDEQHIVDDYLDGIIDAKALASLTNSEKWAGEGIWENWYQPIIDASKNHGGTVIAANAPRRYVQLARKEGYERVRALPSERRQYVEFPKGSIDSPYRNRFVALMSDMSHGEESAANPHVVSNPMIDGMFRSQIMWDATMAGSVAKALSHGASKVVHIAGRFHIGFTGGTVLELRKRKPGARVLTIVMGREGSLELDEADRGLADIVIYTGARPIEPEETVEEEAAPTAESSPESADPESQPTAPSTEPDAR